MSASSAAAAFCRRCRSSKTEGQANFVNPGLFEYNVGWDADLTPKLHLTANANLLRFQYTDVLSRVLFQQQIDKSIGMDYSVGFQYRPALNDNIIITGGASYLHAVGRIQESADDGPAVCAVRRADIEVLT